MSRVEPLVERRRRLVRDDIGRVAVDLFAESGFARVTVDDIAAAAGISQRTFFRYFASKDDVVLDYERRLVDRLVAAVVARPPREGPVKALRNGYLATSRVAPGDRDRVVRLGRILAATPALRAAAHGAHAHNDALLAEVARRMGVAAGDRRPRVVVAAMASVAAAEWAAWVDEGGDGDAAARIGAALSLVEEGLAGLDRRLRARRTRSA